MLLRFNKYLILALVVFNISCTETGQKPFSFVQLCDTQLGMGGYEHDILSFEQAVKQINEINPDFAVVCGDLVNNAADILIRKSNYLFEPFLVLSPTNKNEHHLLVGQKTQQGRRKKIGNLKFRAVYQFHSCLEVRMR